MLLLFTRSTLRLSTNSNRLSVNQLKLPVERLRTNAFTARLRGEGGITRKPFSTNTPPPSVPKPNGVVEETEEGLQFLSERASKLGFKLSLEERRLILDEVKEAGGKMSKWEWEGLVTRKTLAEQEQLTLSAYLTKSHDVHLGQTMLKVRSEASVVRVVSYVGRGTAAYRSPLFFPSLRSSPPAVDVKAGGRILCPHGIPHGGRARDARLRLDNSRINNCARGGDDQQPHHRGLTGWLG